MPIIIAIISILGAAAIWYYRTRYMADAARDLADAAGDVRRAARRFGFKRRTNIHPADSTDDPRLIATGLVIAAASHERAIGQEELNRLTRRCARHFGTDGKEAEEMVIFGRWLAEQFGNRGEAVRRLSRRLHALAGAGVRDDILDMIASVANPNGEGYCELTQDALRTIERNLAER